ncbi:MAG TPA: polysaccharide biosynthesis C-terminal domain-containing protein [Candidatus Gallimonas intestinigallinarum]|uniref:Polysaccharide biosynthesis C-terminal domain-containing protein n=1 Tax=Candidatus Gallimonas intestinigallinarum TaxID=2838604 RepID=A0A9D2IW14_9FIRM|nr:polysaccharide biosynthesis C-terminal domain-containing protein [Candidatus Gallimonas intestinigallinarum]
MRREKSLLINSTTSLLYQIAALICGLIVPRLIISTFGSAINGTASSIAQFISVVTLIQGGVTGAARVAFYSPVSNRDWEQTSVVYKTCKRFFSGFAGILLLYVTVLAFIYPLFIETPFTYYDAILFVFIIGMQSIFESLLGLAPQLLTFADQKAFVNTSASIVCTILNAVISVILIRLGCGILLVKLTSALVFVLRPVFMSIYVRHAYPLNRKARFDKHVLNQSGAAITKSLAFYVHKSTDTLVITTFLNVSWVSVYSVHNYVVSSISNLVSGILGNTESIFGQMIARDEKEVIEKEVPVYDLLSKILATIFFTTTIILISQFVRVYTVGVTDIDYYQPVFAVLLCCGEMVYCMSLTYNNMIMGAGHIKQTQWISIVEAAINIVLSIVLVIFYGLIGVAIGTLVAFIFNSVANIIYMRKHIYKMAFWFIIKSYLVNIVASVASILIFWFLVNYQIQNFLDFFLYAAIVFVFVILITCLINAVCFRKYIKPLWYKLRSKLIRKLKK